MIQTVTKSVFIDAFARIRPDNFTRDALSALYDHFEEIDPNMDLDVVAICCDYSEYSSAAEAAQEMGWERSSDEDEDQAEESAAEWLTGRAELIRVENGSVVVGGY